MKLLSAVSPNQRGLSRRHAVACPDAQMTRRAWHLTNYGAGDAAPFSGDGFVFFRFFFFS